MFHLAPVAQKQFAEPMDDDNYKISDPRLLKISITCLACVILLFLTESLHHITPSWIALGCSFVLLIFCTSEQLEEFIHNIEWTALLFFAGLFIMIQGMAEMGLIRFLGNATADLIFLFPADYRLAGALSLILWTSAICSMFIDNIPFTSTMIFIILQLSVDGELGLPLHPMVWSLALGACLGGNGSIVGASANIVVASISEQHGHKISFQTFFKIGFPIMFISVCISNVYIILRYAL